MIPARLSWRTVALTRRINATWLLGTRASAEKKIDSDAISIELKEARAHAVNAACTRVRLAWREPAARVVGRKGETKPSRRWGSDRRETYFFIITPTKLIFLTHRLGFQMVGSPPLLSSLRSFHLSLPAYSPSLSVRLLRQEKLNPELVVPFLYARCRQARSLRC